MELNFFNSITLLSLFITLVLSFFFLMTKKGEKKRNIILASLLFLFSIQIFYSFAVSDYDYEYFLDWHKLLFILRQTSFLTGPHIYLYFNSIFKKNHIKNPLNLLHIIPFVASLIILMIYYPGIKNFILWKSEFDLYSTIAVLLHNLIYILLSILKFRSLSISLSSFFKTIRDSSPVSWLQLLLLGYLILWILNLNSFAIIMILGKTDWCAFTASIYALILFLFMNSLMLLLLFKPESYFIVKKYMYSSLSEEAKKEYLKLVNEIMEKRQLYLNPDISLNGLSEELSLKPKILSQIINESFNTNFKGFINEFRLKESMSLLSDINKSHKTILEILYETGFNSKSVFNTLFKKRTGLTPLQYREKQFNKIYQKPLSPL